MALWVDLCHWIVNQDFPWFWPAASGKGLGGLSGLWALTPRLRKRQHPPFEYHRPPFLTEYSQKKNSHISSYSLLLSSSIIQEPNVLGFAEYNFRNKGASILKLKEKSICSLFRAKRTWLQAHFLSLNPNSVARWRILCKYKASFVFSPRNRTNYFWIPNLFSANLLNSLIKLQLKYHSHKCSL